MATGEIEMIPLPQTTSGHDPSEFVTPDVEYHQARAESTAAELATTEDPELRKYLVVVLANARCEIAHRIAWAERENARARRIRASQAAGFVGACEVVGRVGTLGEMLRIYREATT